MQNSKSTKSGDLALLGVAALLFAIGATLLHAPQFHTPMLAIRWLAIAVLAAFAWRRGTLTPWIFVAMVAGAEFGFDDPAHAVNLRVFSDIFLRLIKTIVAPLIMATLIMGIAGHGDLKSVGRMGIKSLVFFEVLTTLALVIGLVAIDLSKAGAGLTPQVTTGAAQDAVAKLAPQHWDDFLLHVFPENIAKSIAEGQILQVAVFAVIFGIALASLSEAKRKPVMELAESIAETMFKFTNLVMYLAPIGVGAAMAYTVGRTGLGVLLNLGKLLLTLYGAMLAFAVLVMVPTALLARIPLRRFLQAVAEPATIAFATATSEAALPRAMEAMEAFGVPRRIVAFVIPTGYSFNLIGSAIYLSLASIFVAQAANIHMSFGEQAMMMLTLMLTSKGIAGVPRAAFVVLLATAGSFNLPVWPITVVFGIDALMDMGRTMLNVVGNCLASAVIARWEGEFGVEAPSPVVLEGMAE